MQGYGIECEPTCSLSRRRIEQTAWFLKAMRRKSQKLVLVHATNDSPGAKRSDHDYDIWDDKGKIVGRVFRAANAPKDQPWFWIVTERAARMLTDRGYAATREHALAAFRRAWITRTNAGLSKK